MPQHGVRAVQVRSTCRLAHLAPSCQGVCAVVPSAQPECRPALARQVGAGGLPWWAVTLIVLGACAVFAAAVVGANLIVRTYQRRILGSSPPLASPRGWGACWRPDGGHLAQALTEHACFAWRRPGSAQRQRGGAAGAVAAAH